MELTMSDSRPTVAEIDLSALRHNYSRIREAVSPDCGFLAVVKADAYGHGFMDVALELEKLGVTAFGVAFLAEGIQLRKSGIDRPVCFLAESIRGRRKSVSASIFQRLYSIWSRPAHLMPLPPGSIARPKFMSRLIPGWGGSESRFIKPRSFLLHSKKLKTYRG